MIDDEEEEQEEGELIQIRKEDYENLLLQNKKLKSKYDKIKTDYTEIYTEYENLQKLYEQLEQEAGSYTVETRLTQQEAHLSISEILKVTAFAFNSLEKFHLNTESLQKLYKDKNNMVVKLQDDLDKLETKYDNLFKQLPFMNVREKTTKKRNKKQQEEEEDIYKEDEEEEDIIEEIFPSPHTKKATKKQILNYKE